MKAIAFLLFGSVAILAYADEKLYDDKLATNAVAVMRVEHAIHAKDSTWANGFLTSYVVWPEHIIKDESGELTEHTFRVGVIKGREGIPRGGSTIYLERFSSSTKEFNKTNGFWVLVGGDATNGVSHVTKLSQQK